MGSELSFSEYVGSLGAAGEPPSSASFNELLKRLRGALVHEMKRRGLWSCSPSYLGIYGGQNWEEGDLLEDLLLDCYRFIFISRLPGLKNQLAVRPNVNGLIFLNIRHFLHDSQKRHDPLGFRVFEVLHAAVGRLLAAGTLHVVEGDPKVRNDTVLCFADWDGSRTAMDIDLWPRVAAWNDDLLPELVTAWSKDEVVARLANHLAGLAEVGVEAVRFADLIEPMKDDVRARWQAIRRHAEGETAFEEGVGELASLVRLVRPETSFEERQSFETLLACMAKRLERLEAPGKTMDYLRRLWLFLRDWAAEAGEEPAAGGEERLPSTKKLGELLGIPRGRIGGLLATLGLEVAACDGAVSGKSAVTRLSGTPAPIPAHVAPAFAERGGTVVMDLDRRRERLRRETGKATVRWAAIHAAYLDRTRPPGPGDTFVCAVTSAFPVEWMILDLQAKDDRRALVVPIDDAPWLGSGDIVAAVDGERYVRCRHAAWVDAATLDVEHRTGVVDSEVLEQARRKRAQIEAGTVDASPLERRVDSEAEYSSWTVMLEQALAALVRAMPRASAGSAEVILHPASRRWSVSRLYGLAASVLLLVTLGGLAWQQRVLDDLSEDRQRLEEGRRSLVAEARKQEGELSESRRRVGEVERQRSEEERKVKVLERDLREARREGVQINLPVALLAHENTVRGDPEPLRVPKGAKRLALMLEVVDPQIYSGFRLVIVETLTQREVWRSDRLQRNDQNLVNLDLPRSTFETGDYSLRVYGLESGEARLLEEYVLRLELE